MRTKKMLVILISVLFCLAVLFSCIFVFSVKDVSVTFTVYSGEKAQKINQSFSDKFEGKNLLFISEDEVIEVLENNPYYIVESVQKDYPNVLSIKVKERKATYYIEDKEKVYKTNDYGVVLDVFDSNEFTDRQSRDMIYLTLLGVKVTSSIKGEIIKTDCEELVSTVFEMSKAVNLTDCINHIDVVVDRTKIVKDAIFNTYTGVEIWIENAHVKGCEKIVEGFNGYYDNADDYIKTQGYINVLMQEDDQIVVKASLSPKYSITEVDGEIVIIDLN